MKWEYLHYQDNGRILEIVFIACNKYVKYLPQNMNIGSTFRGECPAMPIIEGFFLGYAI